MMEPPTATLHPPSKVQTYHLRPFSVDEYYAMADAGILKQDEHVELIHGQILAMSPISSRHAFYVDALNLQFAQHLTPHTIVRVQNPIRLDKENEPEPDLALLKPPLSRYWQNHPGSKDTLLVVEVAGSSLAHDRSVKAALYASFGIPELWIIAIEEACIEVYREPTAKGYRQIQSFRHGQTLSVQAFPNVRFAVDDLMP